MSASPGFARRFWPLWLLGLAGVLSLALQPVPAAVSRLPELAALPPFALRMLLLLNPLLLVTAAAAVGAACAHRVGFASRLAGFPQARLAPGLAVGTGLALALVITLLDFRTAPLLGPAFQQLQQAAAAAPVLPGLVVGLLYGGIAEEVILRWGLMSAVAWALLKLTRRGGPLPAGIAWTAIVLAAVLFGAGHLPALAGAVELAPAVVVRTIALNAVAGVAYGWLLWRLGLEAAMLAHAATHLGFALVRVIV